MNDLTGIQETRPSRKPSERDPHPSGIVTLDKKGSPRRTYQAGFFGGSETDFSAVVALPPAIPYAVIRYDAFGRTRGVIAEDGSVSWTSFHSLSTDVCDPNDNNPASEHYRTCTTARTDGHGRTVDQVLRNRQPDSGVSEQYRLFSYYRADNAVIALVRANTTGGRPATFTGTLPTQHVLRTFTYDSVGRRLSSNDPDTDNPLDPDPRTNSWRYLFNRVGDLAAVRDPRGCGQNFFYDLGGRMAGEQYVGCIEAQPHDAEAPPTDNDVGDLISQEVVGASVALDVVYHYDTTPGWVSAPSGPTLGRATGVTDRGQRAALAYDDRGNVIWTSRQIALIPRELGLFGMASDSDPPDQLERSGPRGTVDYDERHTYTRTATFDHASRPVSTVLPSDPDFAAGSAPLVEGLLSYNRRGLPATASARIDGTLYPIVTGIEYLRDALVGSITYGDAGPSRAATRSDTTYDVRRRPVHMRTTRAADPMPTPETLGAVTTIVDQLLVWDPANNLTAIIDHRDASEWPAGHLPQSVHIRHDALYRVINADYDYRQPSGARTVSDLGTDWRVNLRRSASFDPMREEPPDMAPTLPPSRVINLNWSWDYLANQTEHNDDRESFYERSIGDIANGDDLSDTLRPSALYLATNLATAMGTDRGWVEVDYGRSGNMTAMTVHAQCADVSPMASCVDTGSDLAARRAALRVGCACAVEQHYVYRWDELNRLAEARRYDRSASTGGDWVLETRQRYRYDGANARVIKQTLDQNGCGGGRMPLSCERTAIYPYPGNFERRGLVTRGREYRVDSSLGSETQYVIAGARTVFRVGGSAGAGFDREQRLVVPLADLIGTTSAAFDVRTGRLLECSTYYPTGGRETFLNDDSDMGSALLAPEPSGFTGKEADEEVGVVYFGQRYLVPRLGRWASPDPLHVHAAGGGEALNSYHYVGGNLLVARDPLGLARDQTNYAEGRQFQPRPVQQGMPESRGSIDIRETSPGQVLADVPILVPSLGVPSSRFEDSPHGAGDSTAPRIQVRTHVGLQQRDTVVVGREIAQEDYVALSVYGGDPSEHDLTFVQFVREPAVYVVRGGHYTQEWIRGRRLGDWDLDAILARGPRMRDTGPDLRTAGGGEVVYDAPTSQMAAEDSMRRDPTIDYIESTTEFETYLFDAAVSPPNLIRGRPLAQVQWRRVEVFTRLSTGGIHREFADFVDAIRTSRVPSPPQ